MKARHGEPTSSWLVSIVLLTLCFLISGSTQNVVASEISEPVDITLNSTYMDNDIISIEPIDDDTLIQSLNANAQAYQQMLTQQRLEEAARLAEIARLEEEARLAEEARYQDVGVCAAGSSSRKTYMDYRAVSTSSTQGRIISSYTTVQDNGLLMTSDGFIAVALGSRYGALGNKFRITTDTGQVFKVIKVDEKSDAHTTNGCQDGSGAMIEFVVDTNRISSLVSSSGSFGSLTQFSGNIIKVESYN